MLLLLKVRYKKVTFLTTKYINDHEINFSWSNDIHLLLFQLEFQPFLERHSEPIIIRAKCILMIIFFFREIQSIKKHSRLGI